MTECEYLQYLQSLPRNVSHRLTVGAKPNRTNTKNDMLFRSVLDDDDFEEVERRVYRAASNGMYEGPLPMYIPTSQRKSIEKLSATPVKRIMSISKHTATERERILKEATADLISRWRESTSSALRNILHLEMELQRRSERCKRMEKEMERMSSQLSQLTRVCTVEREEKDKLSKELRVKTSVIENLFFVPKSRFW